MKKRVLISLASAALLSVGTVEITNNGEFTPQTVQAAKKAKTFKIRLKKNAKIFTKRGKRKGRKTLKQGHIYTAYGKKTIHGKKYYRLSKSRYIKVVNAKKVKAFVVSNSTSINTGSSSTGSTANSTSTSKTFLIKVTKPTTVYDSKGQSTGITLKKGLKEMTYGTKTINGKKYYLIGGNHYILVSYTSMNNQINSTNNGNSSKPSQDNNNSSDVAENSGKPTKSEIKSMLEGKYVYFTDSQVKQIRDSLWQKIQDYRVSKGYSPYKSNSELDNVIANADADPNIADTIVPEDYAAFGKYVPSLAQKGITSMYGIDNWDYYDATSLVTANREFNFKDRNPEHVATTLFNSLKNDSRYSKQIEGHKDKYAFGTLALHYYWRGSFSSLGLIFVELNGNGSQWINYYNAN